MGHGSDLGRKLKRHIGKTALVHIPWMAAKLGVGVHWRIRQQAPQPHLWRGFAQRSKRTQCELAFPDPMHEFDSGDRNRRTPKSLEPKHGAQTKLDGSMVLFDQIIEVLRRSQLGPLAASMCGEELPGRAVRRLIAIKCDRARQSALTLERPLKKCFRRSDIPLCAQ